MTRLAISFWAYAFAAAALAPVASGAEVYKWVDEKGVTHYSEKPPDSGEAKRIEIAPSPSAAPRPPVNWKEKEAELQRQRILKARSETPSEAEVAKRHDRCLEARRRLDLLAKGRPLYNVNERGERIYLEDKERESESQRWSVEADANCE